MRDVTVVGGGPAGTHVARRLAEAGFEVLLLEEHAAVGDGVICTGIIGCEGFEQFDLPRAAVIGQVQHIRFVSPSGRLFDYENPTPLAAIVDRRRFDAALAERAAAAGVEIWTDCRVEDVQRGARGVTLAARRGGVPRAIESRLCVLATGYGSSLVRRCGFGEPSELVQAAQTTLPARDLDRTEVYVGSAVAPSGFGWAVPIGGSLARIGVVTGSRAPHFLRRLLDAAPLGARLTPDADAIQACPVPLGALAETVDDRLMVVGEAAGQVKTTTQGGIYFGLLGAAAAAAVAAEALRADDLTRARLAEYDRRWRALLAPELRSGLMLRDLCARLTDGQVDRLFEFAHRDEVLPLIRRHVHFDWHGALIRTVLSNGLFASLMHATLGLFPRPVEIES